MNRSKPVIGFSLLIITNILSPLCVAAECPPIEPALPKLEYYLMAMDEARALGLDPAEAAAIMKVESNAMPYVVSQADARGLFQVQRETATFIGIPKEACLLDPEISIKAGLANLADLHETYEGNQPLVWMGYNAGRGNVKRKILPISTNDIWVIPEKLEETYHYVPRVACYYNELRSCNPDMPIENCINEKLIRKLPQCHSE